MQRSKNQALGWSFPSLQPILRICWLLLFLLWSICVTPRLADLPQWPTRELWPRLLARLFNPVAADNDMWQFAEKNTRLPHDIWWHGTIRWENRLYYKPLFQSPPNMRPLQAAPRHPRGLVARQRARLQESDFVPGHSAMSLKTTCEKRGGFQDSWIGRICLSDVMFWTHTPSYYFLADQTKYFFKLIDHWTVLHW